MTALSSLRLGPQDRLTLKWHGVVWTAHYYQLDPKTREATKMHTKAGLEGETAEEVARGAMQFAKFSQQAQKFAAEIDAQAAPLTETEK